MIIRTITSIDKTDNNLESITTLVGPDWGRFGIDECLAWAKEAGQKILQTRGEQLKTDTLLTLKPIPKLKNFFGGNSIF